MLEETDSSAKSINNEEYMSFIAILKKKEKNEIEYIITKYSSYKPEMAEAALYAAVDRGILGYDTKEKLSEQIRTNYSMIARIAKQLKWEQNNAFLAYVEKFSDDYLYDMIDNPSGIAVDVMHAVLVTARDRELISDNDFENMYRDTLDGLLSEQELDRREQKKMLNDILPFAEEPSDAEIEEKIDDYWKCPNCNEIIGMELGICWKCSTAIPEVFEHPDREEIRNELRTVSSFNPYKTGFYLIIAGAITIGLTLLRAYDLGHFRLYRLGGVVFGVLFIVVGAAFIIYQLFKGAEGDK